MFKFIHGDFRRPIEPTEEGLRKHFEKANSISLYGLESKEEADALAGKFPKYTKVRSTACKGSSSFESYGISSKQLDTDNYDKHVTYGISIWVSPVNDVTGQFNETGQKRIAKFIDIIKKEGFIS